MKRLPKLEELSTRQKLGMTLIGFVAKDGENLDYILQLVKERSLGAIWVPITYPRAAEYIKLVKDTADYPILAFADASTGIGKNRVGKHNAIGTTGRPDLAYAFGKLIGARAREIGYDVICSPILDMVDRNVPCAMTERSLGQDKKKVAELAAGMIRGMHDGGILAVGKHYPGTVTGDYDMDSHMAETVSYATREELLEYNLYPYRMLIKEGLLDGIMTKHSRFVNIDPDYPASLSEKMIGIIRDEGFDGFAMTDALCMMGVLAKFGKSRTLGMAIGNGNDFALPYNEDNKFCFEALLSSYEAGVISDERLDEAVRRVIETQAKALKLPRGVKLTDEDIANFEKINTDSVYAVVDEGVPVSVSKEGRHFFVVLIDQHYGNPELDAPAVDTITTSWYKPDAIAAHIRELFPNSRVDSLYELPTRAEATRVLEDNLDYEDVIFVTFFNGGPYIGVEEFTPRVLTIMRAMQETNRISTILHLGNPYLLEKTPHVPRRIFGTSSARGSLVAIDVLAGDQPALGTPTYKVDLK